MISPLMMIVWMRALSAVDEIVDSKQEGPRRLPVALALAQEPGPGLELVVKRNVVSVSR